MEQTHTTHTGLATVDDLTGLEHHEVIDGELVRKASPAAGHADLHAEIVLQLGPQGVRRGGRWRFFIEPIIKLAEHQVYLPDVAGWRIETMPEQPDPDQVKFTTRPDWVCELLSPSTHRNDLQVKRAQYCHAGVCHYWVIDPRAQVMTILRNNGRAFEIAYVVTADDEDIALEPFPECVLNLGLLFAANLPASADGPRPLGAM